jgi:hypothetical protein
MSKLAIRTAFCALFIVLVVFAYGHGYYQGRNAQLSYQAVMDIVKAQFSCKLESR